MEQRLSLITLGVADVPRARAFYEALGWTCNTDPAMDVAFFQLGGMVLAVWSREQLAEDSTVTDGGGWGGVTLAYNVRSPEEVDAALGEAEARGRRSGGRAPRRSGAATRASSSTPTAIRGRSRTTRAGPSSPTAPCGSSDQPLAGDSTTQVSHAAIITRDATASAAARRLRSASRKTYAATPTMNATPAIAFWTSHCQESG